MSAAAQSVSIMPFSPNGIPYQLYADREAVFIITNLPNNSMLQMRYGRIKKINESTYSIIENKCDLVFRDTLEILNNDGFYKTIPFRVAATEMNDSTLYVRYGLSCSSILTKEEFLRDETLYIMPATANYHIDSFTLILLPERGRIYNIQHDRE